MATTFTYPAKIIIAWGEAISGHSGIREWLMANGYPELGLFVHALHNQEGAREWLLKNGFPHLLALINASEGNKQALTWLEKGQFSLLGLIAQAADNDDDALHKLGLLPEKEWFIIAQRIRTVKNQIEYDNNDVHRISRD